MAPRSDVRARTTLIVAPTYQEALSIESFLNSVRDAVPDAHVLIVDDSSPDGTARIVREYAEQSDAVRIIERVGQRGLASAYRQGFGTALDLGNDVIISMDVDGSHCPSSIPSMLEAIHDGADVVIGSRYVDGGETIHWPLRRRLLSRGGNRYAALVLGLDIRDCTSGFRAYRSEALRSLDFTSTTSEGYAFLTELALRMKSAGLDVVELPITFRDRVNGKSTMSWRIIIESMVLINRLALRQVIRRRGRLTRS